MEKVTFASNFWVAPSKARKNGRVENNISFHIARFTFATTVTIANHVSLEVAAKIRDYLQFATDPNTREVVAMSNFTVRLCEQRAWDIKTGGYLENLRVFAESSSVQSNPVVTALEGLMTAPGSFQYKMKYYLDYREHYPDLAYAFECSVDIDPKYHHYYHKLGPEKIRAGPMRIISIFALTEKLIFEIWEIQRRCSCLRTGESELRGMRKRRNGISPSWTLSVFLRTSRIWSMPGITGRS